MTGTIVEPKPNPHSHLSRVDLECAVSYWQPRALALTQEVDRLKTKYRRIERMTLWQRIRWAMSPKSKR